MSSKVVSRAALGRYCEAVLKSKIWNRTYMVPSMEYLSKEEGMQGLYSAPCLRNAWFDRMALYTDKLNKLVSSSNEERPIESLINEYSKSYTKRDVVKYASLIYNLKFAMNSLRGSSNSSIPSDKMTSLLDNNVDLSLKYRNEPLDTGNERLHANIVSSFGSVVEFRTLLLNSNKAISGDGFTWLVARKHNANNFSSYSTNTDDLKFDKLFILNTYNAGSPFNVNKSGHFNELKAQYQKELENLEKQEVTEQEQSNESVADVIENQSYDNNITYIPILAVDASPKAWLHDYGVFGKEQYLNNVWESIEWNVVQSRLPEMAQSYQVII